MGRLIALCLFALPPAAFAQLHFVSIGNWGSGSGTQTSVAATLKTQAREHGISFMVSPGSNFLGGVNDLNDTKWKNNFERPFEGTDLNIPLFVVLGAEDWNGNITAQAERTNMTYAISHDDLSTEGATLPKWTLPNWWYHYTIHFADATQANAAYASADGSASFIFVDTKILADSFPHQEITRMHWNSLRSTIGAAVRVFDWVIVVGDKAILSSGSSKGDEDLGRTLRGFLKDSKVDAYISGNDYDMEVIEDGSLLHINCGTGSGADGMFRSKHDNSALYISKPGFCHHTVTKKSLKTDFVDGLSGKVVGNYTKSRNVKDRSLLDRFHLYKKFPEIAFVPIPNGNVPGGAAKPPGGAGGGPPSEPDLFIAVVGTLGLIILAFIMGLGVTVGGHRAARYSK